MPFGVDYGETERRLAIAISEAGLVQPTAIANGRTTVATAGTRVQMPAVALISGVTIKALPTNTGLIYVGNATVAAANGFVLSARESIFIAADNLNKLHIDSSVNGEGVTYLAS